MRSDEAKKHPGIGKFPFLRAQTGYALIAMSRLLICLLALLLPAVALAYRPTKYQATLGENAATSRGHTLVPKATDAPTDDADGNLTHDGGRSFTRDAPPSRKGRGEMDEAKRSPKGAGAGRRRSHQNRLMKVETDLALVPTGAPASRVTFGYDDLGRRIRQKTEARVGDAWQVAQVRLFLFSGWNVVAEYDAASPTQGAPRRLVQSYLWGLDLSGTVQGAGGVGGLLLMTDHRPAPVGGGGYAYAYDGNGNVLGLVSLADGTVAARYDYDPFGRPLGASGPASALNHFRFSTKYADPFTGLAYYGYRFYDPQHGRWLSRDPLGEQGGLNLHGFVGNDPVNGVDALGLQLAMSLQSQGDPIVLVPAQNGQLYMYVPQSGAFAPVCWNAPIILHDAGVDLWEGVGLPETSLLGLVHAFQQVGEASLETLASFKQAIEWWGVAIPELFADKAAACKRWHGVKSGLGTLGDFWHKVYSDEAFRAAVGNSLSELFDDPATRDKVLANIAVALITGRLAPMVARSRYPPLRPPPPEPHGAPQRGE